MTFKVGDLVIVTKPTICCGNSRRVGSVYKVKQHNGFETVCICGAVSPANETTVLDGVGFNGLQLALFTLSLKKIDPPAEGETREAYKNLKVPA